MVIDYLITEQDYVLFNQFYIMKSDTGRKLRRIMKVVLPLAVWSACAVGGIRSGTALISTLVGLAAALILAALTDTVMLRSAGFTVKLMKKTRELPYPQRGQYIFAEDRITEMSEKGEMSVFYASVKKACCTLDAVYIFIESNQAFIVPYRLFPDANAKNDFIAFLKTKMYVEDSAK